MTRALPIVALVLFACAGLGSLLSRLDRAQLTADTARAETRLLRAELEQHAVAESLAIAHRDVKPGNCELALRRTEALRSAIFALVRTGNVAMPGDPGGAWATWPLRLEATISRNEPQGDRP